MKQCKFLAIALFLAACQQNPPMETPKLTQETLKEGIAVTAIAQTPVIASDNRILRVGKTLEVLASDLRDPQGVAEDPQGRVVFSDAGRQRIFRLENGKPVALVGTGTSFYPIGDGSQAKSAQLSNPHGLTYGPDGNLYFADTDNHRIRMVNKDGVIDTVVGSGTMGFDGDGGDPKTAKLHSPQAVAFGLDGSMYIADTGNQRIRRVKGNKIETVAGNGEQGVSGDKGDAKKAQLNAPTSVIADGESFYFSDSGNGKIRWVDQYGRIDTVADGYKQPTLGGGKPLLVGDKSGLYRLK